MQTRAKNGRTGAEQAARSPIQKAQIGHCGQLFFIVAGGVRDCQERLLSKFFRLFSPARERSQKANKKRSPPIFARFPRQSFFKRAVRSNRQKKRRYPVRAPPFCTDESSPRRGNSSVFLTDVCTFLHRNRAAQPLTAPMETPLMSTFWNRKKSTTQGKSMTVAAAICTLAGGMEPALLTYL